MSIRQVRIIDGVKVLSEPLEGFGGGANETWGKYVEGVIPDDPFAVIADMPVGSYVTDDKQLPARSVPAPYNTEVWITESGTFVAPVTGWYDVTLINGGSGGSVNITTGNPNAARLAAGGGGSRRYGLARLVAGEEYPVTIGAGGIGDISGTPPNTIHGGETSFAPDVLEMSPEYALDASFKGERIVTLPYSSVPGAYHIFIAVGGGPGGGDTGNVTNPESDQARASGHFFGGGGGVTFNNHLPAGADYPAVVAGNGAQGAVRLRYYDPNKENN